MVVHCLGDIAVSPLELSFDNPYSSWYHVCSERGMRTRTPRKSSKVEWSFMNDENQSNGFHRRSGSTFESNRQGSKLSRHYIEMDASSDDDDDDDEVRVLSESAGSVSIISDNKHEDNSIWIPQLHLTKCDKDALLSGEMLTDKHIFAAQKLLAQRTPHIKGLQDPVLSQVGFRPVHKQSVQIHHTQGLHWVVSSWKPGDMVHVYDTLYDFVSEDLLHQLYEIYVDTPHTEDGHVLYDMPPICKQRGSTDCGLFAVALATELCLGSDVTKLSFDQSKMRKHLYKCLRKRVMEPFPTECIEL